MNLSRKQFFKQGIFSLGQAVGTVTGVLASREPAPAPVVDEDFSPTDRPDRMACARQGASCLAAASGCFACLERCEHQAVSFVPGSGIVVDPLRCSGCGTCEYVCPMTPKAIFVTNRG